MNEERYWAFAGRWKAHERRTGRADRDQLTGLVRHEISDHLLVLSAPGLEVRKVAGAVIIGHCFGDVPGRGATPVGPAGIAERNWGNFVAIDAERERASRWVLRAPLGHLPVLYRNEPDGLALSSHADLLVSPESPARIDWEFVVEHLAWQHLKTPRTGLAGVAELLWGECLQLGDGAPRLTLLWSPWTYCDVSRPHCDSDAEAEAVMRAAVDNAVQALTHGSGPYLLELSGGLDSSILASSLTATGACARAVTLSTGSTESDEFSYALAAARAADLDLGKLAIDHSPDLTRVPAMRLARAGLPMILSAADDQLRHLGAELGIAAFVSGAGGDCVFASPASAAPAADALRCFGWKAQTWQTIEALARIHNASVWAVASMAWRQARRGPLHARWPVTEGFLRREALPVSQPDNPWLEEPDGILPGKRSHVRAILASLAHLDGFGRHTVAPTRFPLLSRPVVEAALRIPSWLWVRGGQDRAVARAAFAGRMPAQILERRSKGALDGYALAALADQREALRPFLLEGHLARAGILDLAKLEAALSGRARRGDPTASLLLPLIDTESWIRAWLGEA